MVSVIGGRCGVSQSRTWLLRETGGDEYLSPHEEQPHPPALGGRGENLKRENRKKDEGSPYRIGGGKPKHQGKRERWGDRKKKLRKYKRAK